MTRTEPRTAALLPPVSFSPEEAAAVAMALAARPDGPYAADGGAALAKVLEVLEPDPLRRARLLATSHGVRTEVGTAAERRSVVERAVAGRLVLALQYRDGAGSASHREVEPQLLARSGRHWFLVAWCRERQAVRWFREDRIESLAVTGETAAPREHTDLGAPPAERQAAGRLPFGRHPAGRALGRSAAAAPPRLVVLPGGRA